MATRTKPSIWHWTDRLAAIGVYAEHHQLPQPQQVQVDPAGIEMQMASYADLVEWASALEAVIDSGSEIATVHIAKGQINDTTVEAWFVGRAA